MNANYYRFSYIGICFLAFGVFVSVSVLPLFHILVAIPSIYLSVKYLRDGNKLPSSAIILILYVLANYISSALSFDTLDNPIRSFGRPKYYIFAVLCIPLLSYLQRDYMNEFKWRKVLNIFSFTIIAAAFYGVIKGVIRFDLLTMAETVKHYDMGRAGGFTNIMRYGYGTSYALTFMLGLFLFRKRFNFSGLLSKLFYYAMVFGFVGLLLSKTRGALLGLLVSLPLLAYFYNKKLFKYVFGCITLVVVTVLTVVVLGGSSKLRILSKLDSGSNLKRLSQYQAAVLAFQEKPIFGHGTNEFSSHCLRIKKENNIFWADYCKSSLLSCNYPEAKSYCGHSHNILLENAANVGLVGLSIFILWLLCWTYELYKRQDLITAIYLPFLLNFIVSSQFEQTLNANTSFMIFFLYSLSFVKLPDRFKLKNERKII